MATFSPLASPKGAQNQRLDPRQRKKLGLAILAGSVFLAQRIRLSANKATYAQHGGFSEVRQRAGASGSEGSQAHVWG